MLTAVICVRTVSCWDDAAVSRNRVRALLPVHYTAHYIADTVVQGKVPRPATAVEAGSVELTGSGMRGWGAMAPRCVGYRSTCIEQCRATAATDPTTFGRIDAKHENICRPSAVIFCSIEQRNQKQQLQGQQLQGMSKQ